MELHRRLLRGMLWLLGFSAAAGVLAVFFSTAVMGRVAGTTFIAAVALAAAMPMSRLLDNEKKRLGGAVGLGSIVLSFVAALAAVWVDLLSAPWDVEFKLAATAVTIGVGGTMAGHLLALFETSWARWAARVGLAADVVAAIFLIVSIWIDNEARPAATAWFVLSSGATAAFALIGLGGEPRHWRWIGVGCSVVALALAMVGVWWNSSEDPTIYTIVVTVAAVVAYANAMLQVPLGDARSWTLLAAIGSTALTGACICMLAIVTGGFRGGEPELLVRLTGAGGIASACSTLAVLVMYRLNRRPPGASQLVSELRAVQLTCPHCGRKGDFVVGESGCAECGLIVAIGLREPRCVKCDYSLLHSRDRVCPECGTRGDGAIAARV